MPKKSKTPKEPLRNGFEDDDFRQILEEIEEYEDEKVSIRAAAAGECGGLAKKIKNAKSTAKALGIPLSILNGVLKTRRLERQIDAVAKGIPEDQAELFADASGQFSFLKPVDGETIVAAAARGAKSAAEDNAAAEQAEGEKVLDDLTAVH